MRAILFLNGDPPASFPDTKGAYVVCADGAYNYLSGVCKPDVVVGDFDSADPASFDGSIETVRFPAEKDFTDGELAVDFIARKGFKSLSIYGAFGGRPDHELCNYSLLACAKARDMDAELVADRFIVRLIEGTYSASAPKGKLISLVPFGDKIHILYTKGLKYPAVDLTVDKVHIVSVSNATVGGAYSVSIVGPALLFAER